MHRVNDFSEFSANKMLQGIENHVCELESFIYCFQITETQACYVLLKELYVNLSKINRCK